MMAIGFVSFGLGNWLMTGITHDWDFYELLIPQILRGFGLMMAMVPINNIALGTLPPQVIKGASGLYNLTRNLGGAVGLALINTMINDRTALHYDRLAERVRWGSQVAEDRMAEIAANLSAAGIDGNQAAIGQLVQLVKREASVMAFLRRVPVPDRPFRRALRALRLRAEAEDGREGRRALTGARPTVQRRPNSSSRALMRRKRSR